MVERVGRRFNLRPQRLAGDTVYGAVRLLKWLVDRKITPHVPVWDKSARPDGTFSFRFALPNGIYELTVSAGSTHGDSRQAHLTFVRRTSCEGEVGVAPQDPSLKPPAAESL